MSSPAEPPRSRHQAGEAPGPAEATLADLQCTGIVPDGLRGRFIAVGSQPLAAMVHAVTLHAGQPASYRSRVITSEPGNRARSGTGQREPGRSRAPADTVTANVFRFAGRIFAYVSSACIYELDGDLAAVGPVDLAGGARPIGPHPQVDPATGDLHVVSCAPEAAHHVLAPSLHRRTTRLLGGTPGPVLDLCLSRNRIVLLGATSVGIADRGGDARPRWTAAALAGAVNANDDGGAVEVLATDDSLVRWRLRAGRSAHLEVLDDTPQQRGQINARLVGGRPRYLWSVAAGGGTEIYRHDLRSGDRATRDLGSGRPGAFTYVPDPSRSDREDGGWLVGLVHDDRHAATELVVLDAAAIGDDVAATVRIPRPLPGWLHSTWEPTT